MKKKLAKELKEYYDELEEGLKNTYIMKVRPKLRNQAREEMQEYKLDKKSKGLIKKFKGGSMSEGTAFINSLYKDKL